MMVIKAIAFFLLMTASSRADDDLCEEKYQGDCTDNQCDSENEEMQDAPTAIAPAVQEELCSPPDHCCVKVCEKKWHGHCTTNANCDADEIEVDQPGSQPALCPENPPPGGNRYKCCVNKKKAPCHEIMDGECKPGGCGGGNNLKLGDADIIDVKMDCLCPTKVADAKPHKCCVHKGNDLCEEVKGGKCKADTNECDKVGGKVTGTTLCAGGQVCCVDDQPCERIKDVQGGPTKAPMGICFDEHYCPEGFRTPEENCVKKPEDVRQWCFDDDHLCCMPVYT